VSGFRKKSGSAGSGHHAAAQLRVLHQFAACTAGYDLGGRATHVDVQNIKLHAFFLNDPEALPDRFRLFGPDRRLVLRPAGIAGAVCPPAAR